MATFSWDVFVSYARADDEPPAGAERGWVTTLANELRKVLRRKLGVREARIFMDHRLTGNEGLTESLREKLLGSRTMLLLMSPGYRRSRWCQWELGRFLEAQAERNHRDHIFVIETEPLDRGDWHPALRELIPVRFWQRGFEDKAPRLMGFPVPKLDEDNPYWLNLNELAHLIAAQLQADDEQTPPPTKARVWLAEPTEDLLEERERIVATLRQHDYDVVPSSPLPRDGEEPFRRSLRESLESVELAVQLLGPREGHRPAWGDRSFVALQADTVDAEARRSGLRVLRWRSPTTHLGAVEDPAHRERLAGERVLAVGLEEFKQEILRALKLSSVVNPPPLTGPAGPPHIYVNAESVDRELGRRVLEALEDLGATSALPPLVEPSESPEQIRLAQEAHLEACDGVVLVYGSAAASWVHSQWALARRVLARQQRPLRAAVLNGPPPEKPVLDLRGPGLLALDCRQGFEPRFLADFVQTVQAGAGHV